MNIYCPTFWPNGPGVDHSAAAINLSDLLPAQGSNTFACFEKKDRFEIGETLCLLWCPPVSDLNGWNEQPSEIATSFLLKATVVDVAHHTDQRYELNILSRERLLPALRALQEDANAWHLQTVGYEQGVVLAWDEVNGCARADVEGLVYLTAKTPYESYMELIIEKTHDQISGLFSLHLNPGGSTCELGRKQMTGKELQAVKRALDRAHRLQDTQPSYLIDDVS